MKKFIAIAFTFLVAACSFGAPSQAVLDNPTNTFIVDKTEGVLYWRHGSGWITFRPPVASGEFTVPTAVTNTVTNVVHTTVTNFVYTTVTNFVNTTNYATTLVTNYVFTTNYVYSELSVTNLVFSTNGVTVMGATRFLGPVYFEDYAYDRFDLEINGSGTPAPPQWFVSPSALDFGDIALGSTVSTNLYAQNAGGGFLEGTATIGGPFTVTSNVNFSIGPGEHLYFPIAYTADGGSYSNTLTLTAGTNIVTIPVTAGSYVPGPTLAFSPASISFGSVATNATATNTFAAWNSGGETLELTFAVSGSGFAINPASASLSAGQTQVVSVVFAPSAVTSYSESVTITGGAGGSVALTGSGFDPNIPAISVSPATLAFGDLEINTTTNLSVTVSNAGNGTLSGSASAAGPYSVVSGGTYSLGAGQSQEVVFQFAPTSAGTYNTSFTFTGADGASVSVTGAAHNPSAGDSLLANLYEWWDFEETSGDRAGSVNGAATAWQDAGTSASSTVTGVSGNAISTGGIARMTNVIGDMSAVWTNSWSVAAWYNVATTSKAFPIIGRLVGASVTTNGFVLMNMSGKTTGRTYKQGSASSAANLATTAAAVSAGTWHFAGMSYDAATRLVTVVQDGTITTVTATGPLAEPMAAPLMIGHIADLNVNYSNSGSFIDSMGIWTATLSGAQWAQLYNNGVALNFSDLE